MELIFSALAFFVLGFVLVFLALAFATKPFSTPKAYQLQNVEPKKPTIEAPADTRTNVEGHNAFDDFTVH